MSSVGLALASACGGRAETDKSSTAHAGEAGFSGNLSVGGSAPSDPGISVGGDLIVIPPDLGQPLHTCLARDGADAGVSVTAGTSGSSAVDAGSGASAAGGASGLGGSGVEIDAGVAASGGACPVGDAVAPLFEKCTRSSDGLHVLAVNGGPFLENGACCYDLLVTYPFCGYVGRAFLVEGDMLKSRARKGAGWTQQLAPQLEQLSLATRRALADAWVKDGLFEHASVATFARFAIQLLSVGAPASLLHETLAAGRDEVRHAELCFALASAYAGESLEPDDFPVGAQLPIDRSLAAIVAETIVEGCIGETLAALQAQAQLEGTTDPAVRAALEATVEDETRHAELAWKVVAWAVRRGGAAVRTTAERAFSEFRAPPAPELDLGAVNLRHFAEHGRLRPEQARALALEALETVVRPCAAGLLELDVFERVACAEQGAPIVDHDACGASRSS